MTRSGIPKRWIVTRSCSWQQVGFETIPNYAEESRNPRRIGAQALFAIVPVLLYSFVGVELPATAEEMTDPRRDIPAAIARAGIGQALMYGIPMLAVLIVLPAGQMTSLHGLIDAIQTVLTATAARLPRTVRRSSPAGGGCWAGFARSYSSGS
jgi:amino acid transporter